MKKISIKNLYKKLNNSFKSKKIVMTNGCFDIIHSGHIEYLRKSKKCGDVLIVAINSDLSVKLNKGKNRPIINLKDRVKILSELNKGKDVAQWRIKRCDKLGVKYYDLKNDGTMYTSKINGLNYNNNKNNKNNNNNNTSNNYDPSKLMVNETPANTQKNYPAL